MVQEATRHVRTTIRYDGPDLSKHEMDVQEIAPALLALAELIQFTNRKYNGDGASMKVLVRADVEQSCFQLDIHIVQSLLEAAQGLFSTDEYKTAKEIGEVLGLLGIPVGGGVFWFWKKFLGKAADPDGSQAIYQTLINGDVTVIQNFYGEGLPLEVPTEVYDLATDPIAANLGKKVLHPLKRPGYETLGFYQGDKQVVEINEVEARRIIQHDSGLLAPEPDETPDGEPTEAIGPAWVDTSHFRGVAKWALLWNGIKIDAKMPDAFIDAFQSNEIIVVPNTKLTVRMTITPKIDENGNPLGLASFVVTEVLHIELPPKAAVQTKLFDDH